MQTRHGFFNFCGATPYVCKYDQDEDKVRYMTPVARSVWASILPYFNSIVAGTWWQAGGRNTHFRFLMNNGNYLTLDFDPSIQRDGRIPRSRYNTEMDFKFDTEPRIQSKPITADTWPGLERYKDRIITAVQNDHPLAASLYYIFLTNNEYIRFNISTNRAETGPIKVDDHSWPGLLRN